ncbi:hypothetical protein EKK58_09095 [Candidatus Dependentiae bacterium]|nr:MAG: hypothetical protein EKK58_09095 [Candidatus Dependentiae bacterium]
MKEAHLDFETRSTTDLRKSGVYRYAEDPNTRPWGFCYQIGDAPRKRWVMGDAEPTDLLEHIANGGVVTAHNSAFERVIWNFVLRRWYPHWPEIKIEQQDCTMARAAAIAHPQTLDGLGKALHSHEQKDKEGHALMMKMSRPRRFNADGTIVWWDEPHNVDRLMLYCDQDIATEVSTDKLLPPLTDYERQVWRLDQTINERGVPIDVPAVEKAVTLVELAKKSADQEMRRLTGRAVPKCSNDRQIISWINGRGIECTTVAKGEQEDLKFMASLYGDELVRDVIDLRADSKKTSTAKYKAMTECVSADGRIRGMLAYHAASTGRWAGRLVQMQNFPRVDYKKEGYIFEWILDMLDSPMSAKEVFDIMTSVYGESGQQAPLRLLSRMLRACIKAEPGTKLIGGDFSNIEGRVNAWLAGEHWKLAAFREYDNGTGPDLYNLAYARSFGVDINTVTDPQRQIGKVQELALGYQGSVGAYMDMGDNYGVNPYDLTGPVKSAAPAEQWDFTAAQYATANNKNGLQEAEWTALTILVTNWRKANPAIVQSWWDYQDAAVAAVSTPGVIQHVGIIQYYSDGRCLWCILPSGRTLCYAAPEIKTAEVEYICKFTGDTKTRLKNTVYFWGYKEGRWQKMALYGGLQCENIVQAVARDIMVDRMFAVEQAGYPIILTVHDELLSQVRDGLAHLNSKNFQDLMCVNPEWALGLPLTAKAWEDMRYVK